MIPQYITFLLFIFSVTTPSNYATPKDGAVTPFWNAFQSGTIALIAHNYKAGEYFDDLTINDEIVLIYSDKHIEKYVVSEMVKYIALQPSSVYSDFVPDGGGVLMTSTQLYREIYGADDSRIVLQTCYDGNNGRLFILAYPKKEEQVSNHEQDEFISQRGMR